MGAISELLHITYGDNCISLFDRHGFVWDWQTIQGFTVKAGYIVTSSGMLQGYDNIRNVAPIYGSLTVPNTEIIGYAILKADVMDKVYQIGSGEQLFESIDILRPDDTIETVKARIQRYTRAYPEIAIRVDRLAYRLKLKADGEPYFKLETSRNPRRNV